MKNDHENDDIYNINMENGNDGKIILTFLDNKMEVRGDFFPPVNDGMVIRAEYILSLLEKHNIVYGIQHGDINKAFEACVNNGEIVRDVCIAKGEPPADEVPEFLQFNPHLLVENGQLDDADSVDHRARSAFTIVKQGQALAKLKHGKPGKNGMNVHGEILEFKITKPQEVSAGENTKMEGRFLLSAINGQLVFSRGVVSVRDSLVIKGPVDYTTGNIIFPGDVEIEGPVSDGFKIYSGGSVTIRQTYDVTEAIIKNNLNVAGGIIGRGKAVIKVGGSLKTKFIENCHIAARKTIIVEAEIINSKVFSLETLEMGDKGQIVGGEIYALKGIRAGNIGKETGKAARIHCGIDFTLEQEKERNNGILRILAAKQRRLKELMEDQSANEEKKEKMEALLKRLEQEQLKAQGRVSELLGKLNAYRNAVVEVKGEISSGTLIEICQVALYVTTPLKKVRIRLDQRNGRLITENL